MPYGVVGNRELRRLTGYGGDGDGRGGSSRYSTGGSDWSKKPCKNYDTCGNMVSYKDSWDHPPNYCDKCKEKFKDGSAGTLKYNRDQKQWHEHHGQGTLRSDGGIEFNDNTSSGKHSHTARDKNFKPRWHRHQGFNMPKCYCDNPEG